LGDTGEQILEQMQDAINRADLIIRGMVEYSRSDELKKKSHDMNKIVQRALRMVQHEVVRANVNIEMDLADEMPKVSVDQTKIEQVLINFLTNAIQAMADSRNGEVLRIQTFWDQIQAIERDEGIREFERLRAHDPVVVVEIRDQGPGIPADRLTRIFEPFYTTKPTGEGTGLGLSVAKNIVDLHRGHIQVRNVEDPKGLRVRLFLKARNVPRDEEPPEEMRLITRPIKLKM
jgi:signal transduction histidine kinase